MSALSKRIGRLEAAGNRSSLNPELTVILDSFGAGEYVRATANEKTVHRIEGEDEETFQVRAVEELREIERAKTPPNPVLVVHMGRSGNGESTAAPLDAAAEWPKDRTILWPIPATELDD